MLSCVLSKRLNGSVRVSRPNKLHDERGVEMYERVILTPDEMRAMMPRLRGASLYEVEHKTTYWCIHRGRELGPKVLKEDVA
jgi:hypothetical protein